MLKLKTQLDIVKHSLWVKKFLRQGASTGLGCCLEFSLKEVNVYASTGLDCCLEFSLKGVNVYASTPPG